MSWYYAEGDVRHGPIEDPAFQALVGAGAIQPNTLVWREGFGDWIPYGQISQGAAEPTAAATRPSLLVRPASGGQACSQCGQLFAVDEMVSYEGRFICAGCKPAFFQRIKEGVSVAGPHVYAGFWIRFGARIVDGFILGIGLLIIWFIVGMEMGTDGSLTAFVKQITITNRIGMLLNAAYVIFFIGKFGATPGKMACKLEVIRPDGSPMTYGRATGRFFAEIVTWFTLTIGYIMAAFDEEKRALHDRIADTRVVRKL